MGHGSSVTDMTLATDIYQAVGSSTDSFTGKHSFQKNGYMAINKSGIMIIHIKQ